MDFFLDDASTLFDATDEIPSRRNSSLIADSGPVDIRQRGRVRGSTPKQVETGTTGRQFLNLSDRPMLSLSKVLTRLDLPLDRLGVAG